MSTRITSGRIVVGMHAPIQLQFGATVGVNFATAAQLDLTLRAIHLSANGVAIYIMPDKWVWSDKTPTGAKATWSPTGSEFALDGLHHFSGTLVADGVTIDLLAFDEWVYLN